MYYDAKPQIDDVNGKHIVSRRAMTFSCKYKNIGFCFVENLGHEYWKLGTGYKFTDKLSVGVGLDLTSIDYGMDFVWTIDFSVNYRFNENWNAAILCQSIDGNYANYRPSIAFTKQNTVICFEWYDAMNNVASKHFRLGFEQKIANLYFRLGANDYEKYLKNGNNNFTTYFGLGYQFDKIRIDIGTIQDNAYSLGVVFKH